MAASIAGVFEENLQKKIVESKILVVGAGGIGCEVLKNLVLSGFADIEIVSNLVTLLLHVFIVVYSKRFSVSNVVVCRMSDLSGFLLSAFCML